MSSLINGEIVCSNARSARGLAAVIVALMLAPSAYAQPPCSYDSAILDAVANRDVTRVRVLLAVGANPNAESGGYSALMMTFLGNASDCKPRPPSPELLRILVQAGADMQRTSSAIRDPFPHIAVVHGNVEILRAAIEAGAPVDLQDRDHRTPLLRAAELVRPEVVDFLLNAGANPNARDRSGHTSLHYAARNGGPGNGIAKALVARGAKYQGPRSGGPFFWLGQNKGDTDTAELIRLLVRAGGDINEQSEEIDQVINLRPVLAIPRTPLTAAFRVDFVQPSVLEAMLKAGADPNRYALYALMQRGDSSQVPVKRKDIVELLFRHGARADKTERLGTVSVLEAARQSNPAYGQELLEATARYRK